MRCELSPSVTWKMPAAPTVPAYCGRAVSAEPLSVAQPGVCESRSEATRGRMGEGGSAARVPRARVLDLVERRGRLSSKEQEREGYSIPAQQKLLRGYAITEGVNVLHEFVDVETAKESGRKSFGEMLKFLEARRPSCRIIVVEKTDRLYRNLVDYLHIDRLDVEVHLVKEGVVLSRESRSRAPTSRSFHRSSGVGCRPSWIGAKPTSTAR
jgi:hypothetical protein